MATRHTNSDGVPLWALYRHSTSAIEKRRSLLPNRRQEIPPDLDPDLAWLEEWIDDPPAFDPATHKLERTETALASGNTGTLTYGAQAVPLDADELGAVARRELETASLDAARPAAAKVVADERIGAAEEIAILKALCVINRLDL